MGELWTPKVAHIFANGKSTILLTTRRVRSGPARARKSKRVIQRKDVLFEGLSNVHLNFGSHPPPQKNEILGPWIGLSSVNDNTNVWCFNKADHDEILQGIATPWMGLHWWSHDFPQQIRDGGRRLLWISLNANITALDEDIYTKFGTKMEHDHSEMPTWPKTELKVNSHDIITSTTGNNCNMAFSLQIVESVSDNYNF